MKKLVLIAGLSLFSLITNAQDGNSNGLKGTWWVAGQVSFDSSKTGTAKEDSNMILPIVGTFVGPSTTVGLGVGTINSKAVNTSGVTTSNESTFVVKPLVRKYWNITGGLFFYGQAALPIMSGKDKIAESKFTSVALEVSPGFDYIVNKWFTMEASFPIFKVGSTTSTPKVGDKTTDFGVNANPMNSVADRSIGSLQLGVKFLF